MRYSMICWVIRTSFADGRRKHIHVGANTMVLPKLSSFPYGMVGMLSKHKAFPAKEDHAGNFIAGSILNT